MFKDSFLSEKSSPPAPTSEIMSALFSSVDDGIIILDQSGKIIFSNDAAIRINDNENFPSEPNERIHNYTSRIGEIERAIELDELPSAKTLHDGEIRGQEVVFTSSKGLKKNLSCNGRALYNSEGKKIGAILVLHDKTQQWTTERQKADLEKEQIRLLHMNAELENFSAIAAHDLKSPLNSITQYAELIQEDYADKLGPEGSDLLQVIVNAGDRLRSLIDDLLSYARAGKDLGALTSFDTRILLDETLIALHGIIQKTGASVEVDSLPVIVADRVGISQVFQNLISNALKYRGKTPPIIKIKASDEGQKWCFQIQDNGIGIRTEDQKAVFDLFKRVEGCQQAEGTGLGLPICKRIIEFHGGSLWLSSEKGVGTNIYFTLPKRSR